MTEPAQDPVKALAETIAKEIVARQSDPTAPVTFDAAELAATYNGTFTLAIKYQTTTYTLAVTIPTQTGGTYDFELTMTPDGKTAESLGYFKYTASDNWSVSLSNPVPIPIGSVITIETLKLAVAATPSK